MEKRAWRIADCPSSHSLSSILYLLSSVLLLGLAACDTIESDRFEEEYVVEAYLIAAEPLSQVRLTRTAPLDATFDATALAVSDAQVEVHLLADDGSVVERYAYAEVDTLPGIYRPIQDVLVQPLATYRLGVTTSTGDAISAETLVPGDFEILFASAETLPYQSPDQLELNVTRSAYPGREQTYFTVVTESLDPREDMLVPFAADLYDGGDSDLTLDDLTISGSPPFNEANFDINADNTLTIRYPWFGIAFYGPNRIYLNAVDDNLYDFLRSAGVQQGGSTFSPGEIPDVINRVNGAVGIFGSLARVQYELVVEPQTTL